MDPEKQKQKEAEDAELRELFPLFKSWRSLYFFVLGELTVLILLFYWFSQAFS